MEVPPSPDFIAFEEFAVDLRRQELRRDGRRVKLQEQPCQVLIALLERPGEIVTKEELRERLWPEDTHVEFDNSLSVAILKIRRALRDEAADPRFIETIPRHGYRFVGPLRTGDAALVGKLRSPDRPLNPARRRWILSGVAALALLAAAGAYRYRSSSSPPPLGSLAILPFENADRAPDVDYLCEGIPRSISSRLARAPDLEVIPPQSVMSHAGLVTDLPRLTSELDVEAVLVGGLSQRDERVFVDVQLIEARSGRLLWGDRYEETTDGLLAVERSIADRVLTSLHKEVTLEDRRRIHAVYTENEEAYKALLMGSYVFQHAPNGMEEAAEWFEKAAEIDPGYAPAWVCLYTVNLFTGHPKRAREAAERAIGIRDLPVLSEYRRHFLRASVLALLDREWGAAEEEFEKARALSPRFELPNYYLMWTGHLEEAVEQLDRDTTQGAPWQLGWIPPFEDRYDNTLPLNALGFSHLYFQLGEFDKAMAQARWLLELDLGFSTAAHFALADCYSLKGQENDAMREWAKAMSQWLGDEELERYWVAHREAGMRGVYQLVLDELPEQVPPGMRTGFYLRVGDRNRVFQSLERDIETPSFFPPFLDPYLASFRDDPRFERLLRKAKLPEDAIARHLAH
jgi:DNA-binding winged helix-turn-helix (wHTH) protein/TolB-like protein